MFTGFKNTRYIKFLIDEQGNKTPADRQKPVPTYALEDIINFKETNAAYAVVIPDGVVVVDSDTKEEGDIIVNCVKDTKTRCYISKSTKGYHFYFKIPNKMRLKQYVDASVPLGLIDLDYKSGQTNSNIIQYRNGKWDEWLDGFEPKDSLDPYEHLDELPFWLYPLVNRKGQLQNVTTLRGMDEGDGRNNKLNSLREKMVFQYQYTQSQVTLLFELINNYVFATPLPKNELDTLSTFRDIDRKAENERWLDRDDHFQHNLLGDYLIKLLFCYKDDNRRVWYFNNKFYTPDDYVLEEKIVEIAPELTTRQRNEVLNYVKLTKIESNVEPSRHHFWVCCENMLIDGATGHTMGHNPAVFCNNMLNLEYDKNAYDEHVDNFLNDVLVEKGDKEQRLIFEEYLGYTLFSKDNFAKKMLINIGPNANNGKTTTTKMVMSLLNGDNYSTVKLSQMTEKNQHILPQLVDKIANFDDEGPTMLEDSSVEYLKTMISNGNEVTVNPKYKDPFKTQIHAKFWTNTNHIIKTSQKGEEWMTRLLILAYNNMFVDDKVDWSILDKITTRNAKSYLFNLALAGFQRLIKNGKFTESAESKKWILQYRIENDNVFTFLHSHNYLPENFIGKNMQLASIYTIYKEECKTNDIKYMNQQNFGKRFLEYFKDQFKLELDSNNWVIKEVEK